MKNSSHRFIRALLKQPVDRTPIWIMRQAGRYLPEYRKIRNKTGKFLTLCKTPELACEVTLQPLERFNLDAAIIFSDILTLPDAMGLGLYFIEGEGPKFHKPLKSLADIKALSIPDPEDLSYVMDAITLTRQELKGKVPLIGFAGSPWTLACYMLEGGGSKEFRQIKTLLYQEPKILHLLLNTLTKATNLYLNAQIVAGAQTLMIFDTWGGLLTSAAYQEFSLNYMSQIVANLKENSQEKIPIILFTKGGNLWLDKIAMSGCDAISLDWTIDIGLARQRLQDKKIALQGNMDPAVLFGNPETIRHEVKNILQSYGHGSGHIFNLGHGVSQYTQPENINLMIKAIHEFSPFFHKQYDF